MDYLDKASTSQKVDMTTSSENSTNKPMRVFESKQKYLEELGSGLINCN